MKTQIFYAKLINKNQIETAKLKNLRNQHKDRNVTFIEEMRTLKLNKVVLKKKIQKFKIKQVNRSRSNDYYDIDSSIKNSSSIKSRAFFILNIEFEKLLFRERFQNHNQKRNNKKRSSKNFFHDFFKHESFDNYFDSQTFTFYDRSLQHEKSKNVKDFYENYFE